MPRLQGRTSTSGWWLLVVLLLVIAVLVALEYAGVINLVAGFGPA